VPECPICRRTYDERFKVFVPPYSEAYDTIDCARKSAQSAAATRPSAPVILPMIEIVRPAPLVETPPRRAGTGTGAFAPAQLALAGGVGLLAAGTAAAVYLAASPPSRLRDGTTIAAGARPTLSALPAPPTNAAPGPTVHRVESREQHAATIGRTRPKVVQVAHAPALGSSAGHANAQLASRILPSSSAPQVASAPVDGKAPQQQAGTASSPHPKQHRTPPVVHRSPKPTSPKPKPHVPTTPATPTPPTDTTSTPPTPAPTEPDVAVPTAEALASVDTGSVSVPTPGKNHHDKPPPPPPPPPQPPPPPPPPPTTGPDRPPPSDGNEDDGGDDHGSRPGNGYGDKNHDHTGPPGHGDRGESGSRSCDDGHGGGRGHGRDD
jgi:hypothetical protein